MKVKELIKLLSQKDPEKEVMIQQGEEYDYMAVDSIRDLELMDMTGYDDDVETDVVVIDTEVSERENRLD